MLGDLEFKFKFIRGLPSSTYAERGRGGVGPNAYAVSEVAWIY